MTSKAKITAALAALLLAGTASAALAQEHGGHRGQRGDGPRNGGGERQQFRDTERRDMTGGEDRRGQRRSQFQADQAPRAPQAPREREAREAPAAPAAVQAPEPRPRAQFRGDGGQGLPNVRDANRDGRRDGAQRWDGNRDGARPADANRDGRRDGGQRWDGNRNGVQTIDPNRDGRRDGGQRWDGNRDGVRGGDVYRDGRRDGGQRWDGNRRGDRNQGGWDRRDDRGRPHWQQGRYPSIYRSPQRYRYGFYRPPIGFYTHSWGFGEYLPRGWYGSEYLLNDWWSYDLPYPPPGYDWVRVGDDALLIDQFTGRVVQVVRDIFW